MIPAVLRDRYSGSSNKILGWCNCTYFAGSILDPFAHCETDILAQAIKIEKFKIIKISTCQNFENLGMCYIDTYYDIHCAS